MTQEVVSQPMISQRPAAYPLILLFYGPYPGPNR